VKDQVQIRELAERDIAVGGCGQSRAFVRDAVNVLSIEEVKV
jgi:hypothetical protein